MSASKQEIVLGNYRIGKTLGEGTFGKVKLGIHIATEEKVAVKILQKEKIVEQADMERVTREICILKILRHPNIIQLYEIIETKKDIYLIMEYADGGELFEYIVKKKRVEEKEAVVFMQQILSGVDYLHKNGVVHRDLKPQNLLLDHNRNIKIVDFGLSNQYKPGQKLKTACGSPCYAAPEMIAGKAYECSNVDVWSCGVIMYALLCGYLPFEDPNTNKLYRKILAGDFEIPKFITPDAKDLMKKILNVDPQTRYKISQIKDTKWYNLVKERPETTKGIIVGKDNIEIDERVFKELEGYGIELKQARTYILNNRHNPVTSIYYLLIQKYKREGPSKRSESPMLYRPNGYDQKASVAGSLTDREYMVAKQRKRLEIPDSTKNDSMNASNIISSLMEANKNKATVNAIKSKKPSQNINISGYEGDLNFDRVQENKHFPHQQNSQLTDRSTVNNSSMIGSANTSSINQPIEGRASLNVGGVDKTRRIQQPRISLNEPLLRGTPFKKEQNNYLRKNELSEQLKQISIKIDKEIQELKKQNDSYINAQFTERSNTIHSERRDSNPVVHNILTPGAANRKKISLDVNMSERPSLSGVSGVDKTSRVYESMGSYSGPYNPRCVFGSNPRIILQKILAFLESNKINFAKTDNFTVQVERRGKISLQMLQNLPSVFIINFSEKLQIAEKLLNFLQF